MLRRYTHGGSALDLREASGSQMSVTSAPPPTTQGGLLHPGPTLVGSHSPGKLRRVFTAHVRRNSQRKQAKGFSLKAMLKEPLRLVNSVPLNFDYSRYVSGCATGRLAVAVAAAAAGALGVPNDARRYCCRYCLYLSFGVALKIAKSGKLARSVGRSKRPAQI